MPSVHIADVRSPHTTHVLRARDISVSGTASFGVLVAVAFAALTLLCIFGNTQYRRVRLAQRQLLVSIEVPAEPCPALDLDLASRRPLLWDCHIRDGEKTGSVVVAQTADWTRRLPITVRRVGDLPSDATNAKALARRSRSILSLRKSITPTKTLAVLEVVTLVAMPSFRRMSGDALAEEDSEQWDRHVIGIARVAYDNTLIST